MKIKLRATEKKLKKQFGENYSKNIFKTLLGVDYSGFDDTGSVIELEYTVVKLNSVSIERLKNGDYTLVVTDD